MDKYEPVVDTILYRPVEDLELRTATIAALKREGFETVGQVAFMRRRDWVVFSPDEILDIVQVLEMRGLISE